MEDEAGEKSLVTIRFSLSLPQRIFLRPSERLYPMLQAIGDSIDDAIFLVLDQRAHPLMLNKMGLDTIRVFNMAHPPMLPLGPGREVPEDEQGSHTPYDSLASSLTCPSSSQLSRLYSSNWINTWIPETVRDEMWDTWRRLIDGRFNENGSLHVFQHLIRTGDGVRMVYVTDTPVFDANTNNNICTVHILHLEDVGEDPRVIELAEELKTMMSLG